VVHLLETTLIRVGNDEYAKANESYGLTTLRNEHVAVEGSEVRFRFTGKSGKQWSLAMRDRRVARILRACQELPGQDLLQYFDDNKELRAVSSGESTPTSGRLPAATSPRRIFAPGPEPF
jgi:DNA topoisomerase-1